MLATCGSDINLYEWPSCSKITCLQHPGTSNPSYFRHISWNSTGRKLAAATNNTSPLIINHLPSTCVGGDPDHNPKRNAHFEEVDIPQINALSFSKKKGSLVLLGSEVGQVYSYHTESRRSRRISKLPSGVNFIESTSSDTFLGVGCRNGQIYLFDGEKLDATFNVPKSRTLSSMVFHPREVDSLGGASHEGVVVIWDVATSAIRLTREDHEGPVTDLGFCLSSGWLGSVGVDGDFNLYDLRTKERVFCTNTKQQLTALGFPGAGNQLLVGTAKGKVLCYDNRRLPNPKMTFQAHNSLIRQFAFRDDVLDVPALARNMPAGDFRVSKAGLEVTSGSAPGKALSCETLDLTPKMDPLKCDEPVLNLVRSYLKTTLSQMGPGEDLGIKPKSSSAPAQFSPGRSPGSSPLTTPHYTPQNIMGQSTPHHILGQSTLDQSTPHPRLGQPILPQSILVKSSHPQSGLPPKKFQSTPRSNHTQNNSTQTSPLVTRAPSNSGRRPESPGKSLMARTTSTGATSFEQSISRMTFENCTSSSWMQDEKEMSLLRRLKEFYGQDVLQQVQQEIYNGVRTALSSFLQALHDEMLQLKMVVCKEMTVLEAKNARRWEQFYTVVSDAVNVAENGSSGPSSRTSCSTGRKLI